MWPVVASHFANFLVISRSEFDAFWRMSLSHSSSIKMSVLSQFDFYNQLSLQTRQMIVQEMSYIRYFDSGQTVMKWHQKSPWNHSSNETYEKYRPMISTLQDEKGNNSNVRKVRIAKVEAKK